MSPVTECGLCNLIQGQEVSQEYISMDFNERHQEVGDRPIYPNTCLPWMMLSMEEREKVLENNELFCKLCLRSLKRGRGGSACGPGRHTVNTGYNGMCSVRECERHVTMCKRHEPENKNRHKIYKRSLDWAQSFRPQQDGQQRQQTSLLMLMADESEQDKATVISTFSCWYCS